MKWISNRWALAPVQEHDWHFPTTVATRDPVTNPMDEDILADASRPAAAAHLALLNAIRQSMGRTLEELTFYLGGTLGPHPEGTESPIDDSTSPAAIPTN
jgi:hypothetical protein